MQNNINLSYTNHMFLLNRLLHLDHRSLRALLHIVFSNCQPHWPSNALCKMMKNDPKQHFSNFTGMLKYGKIATLLCGAAGTHSNRIYQKNFFASVFRMSHNWSQEDSSTNLWTKHNYDKYFGKFNYSAPRNLQPLEEINFLTDLFGLVICKGTNNV